MRRFVLLPFLIIAIVASLFATPPARAQYAIPDCFVAAFNATFPQEEFWASRDSYYRQLDGEWQAMTAGLTADQITAYTSVFCGSLQIFDRGENADASGRLVEWSYVPVSTWRTNGGSPASTTANSASSGSAAGVTSASSGSTASVTSPSSSVTSAGSSPAAQTSDIFNTEFDSFPANDLVLLDGDFEDMPPQIVDADGDSALRIKTTELSTLYYTDGTLADYGLEVRTRINAGEIMLTIRAADDYCAGYDFGVYPVDNYAYLQISDEDCNTTVLAELDDLSVENGDWMTLRFEASGSQLTAFIDDAPVMTATDATYTAGFPTVYVFTDLDTGEALIDISALRVTQPDAPSTPVIAEGDLTQYAGPHAEAIAELQALGIVPQERGTFIFQEPTAYFEGDGSWFTPLARSAPHTNIVMAGNLEVTFNGGGEYELCTLMSRVVTVNSSAVQELSAGLDSDGDVIIVDSDDPDSTNVSTFQYETLRGNLDTPHHFMIVAQGNVASVYVDGHLVFDRVKVQERSGTYGIGLTSHDGDSRCEANNLWVYSFD